MTKSTRNKTDLWTAADAREARKQGWYLYWSWSHPNINYCGFDPDTGFSHLAEQAKNGNELAARALTITMMKKLKAPIPYGFIP
jgi:hypothetical protein